jgi:hypothetical protein
MISCKDRGINSSAKDMDLYDDSRTLVYSGPTLRRARTDTGFSEKWTNLVAALLDNYC